MSVSAPSAHREPPAGAGNAPFRVADWVAAHCHRIYALIALPAVIFLAFLTPPFQVPDEVAHFYRAEQVSHGQLIGVRRGSRSGGDIDAAAQVAAKPFARLHFRGDERLDRATLESARAVQWSGTVTFAGFPNTVNYGPAYYLPQAVGIWVGKRAGLGVIDTMYLARVLNGVVAVCLSLLALRICSHGRTLMFTVLLLPMTIFQYASLSQDALLIATAMLALGILSRVVTDARAPSVLEYGAFLALISGAAMARVTHVAFFLLVPLLRGTAAARTTRVGSINWRLLGAGVAVCVPVAWAVYAMRYTMVPMRVRDGIDPGEQLRGLVEQPIFGLFVLANGLLSISWDDVRKFIGVLGWLDTDLPGTYYWLAFLVFGVATLERRRDNISLPRLAPWMSLATLIAFVTLTFGVLYLTWTPLGAVRVEGIQGRYFLPIAPLIAWLVPRPLTITSPEARTEVWIAIVLLVVITLVVVPSAIFRRYYL